MQERAEAKQVVEVLLATLNDHLTKIPFMVREREQELRGCGAVGAADCGPAGWGMGERFSGPAG